MNASRLIAIFLVVGTVIWIGSAYLVGDDTADDAAMAQADDASTTGASGTANAPGTDGATRASVRTITSNAVDHVDFLRVSGRTEAVISGQKPKQALLSLALPKASPSTKAI